MSLKPGSKGYEKMVEFMRVDLDSCIQLIKFEVIARKLLKTQGRDFDTEFAKWQKEKKGRKHLLMFSKKSTL